MSGQRPRNGFVSRSRVEAATPLEARRQWLMFLSLARDHCRRAFEGAVVDRFEASQFAGFSRQLFAPFPVPTPASALSVANGARDIARGLVTSTAPDDRRAVAKLLV